MPFANAFTVVLGKSVVNPIENAIGNQKPLSALLVV